MTINLKDQNKELVILERLLKEKKNCKYVIIDKIRFIKLNVFFTSENNITYFNDLEVLVSNKKMF